MDLTGEGARAMFRFPLVVLMAAGLSGCAVVGSEQPLFGAADARGDAPLRTGLWAMPDDGCVFDPAEKSKDWNDCANATLVGPATFSERPKAGEAGAKSLRYVLAGGAPRVVQIQAPPGESDPNYAYAGLRVLRADAAGRIVEARVWLAMCEAPPDPKALEADAPRPPLPAGLLRDPEGPGCAATTASAVRAAVARSEAWAEGRGLALTAHWIRDAD